MRKLQIGPFLFTIPNSASIEASMSGLDSSHPKATVFTVWDLSYEGVKFVLTLDYKHKVDDMKMIIENEVRKGVFLEEVEHGSVLGQLYHANDYYEWWFSGRDSVIQVCLNLNYAPKRVESHEKFLNIVRSISLV